MRYTPSRLAAAVAALAFLVSSTPAQDVTPATSRTASVSQRFSSPIVKAVRSTRESIVTNRHVVGSNSRVPVRLFDGTELVGQVVVAETRWDLAVVQIQAEHKLKALAFARADDLEVGETVIAIGHPYGYSNTVSTGIISALQREITMPTGDTISGLIQTDASINPGNSGGPLLNIDGELIGINVALREGAQGIAFAINAGMVRAVLARHLSSQYVAGQEISLQGSGTTLGTQAARLNPGASVGIPAGSGR
jgi:serine protease Do